MSVHVSKVRVDWTGGFSGRGQVRSPTFTTPISLPKDFGGLNLGASPEDLLLSSIVSCYTATLGIILDKAGVGYEALSVQGELVTRTEIPASIQEVNLILNITTETSKEAIEILAKRVDGFCVVAKVLRPDLKKTVHINHRASAFASLSAGA